MKKYIILILLMIMFVSCNATLQESTLEVVAVERSYMDKYKYEVKLYSNGGTPISIHTNTYYTVGEMLKLVQE